MARKAYVRTDNALGKINKLSLAARQEISDMTIEVAEFGAEVVREIIRTEGTNRIWPGGPWRSEKTGRLRFGSGPGRIDSGDMLNNVTVQFQRGDKQSRAVFGWVRTYEEYYKYQEEGFIHWKSGESVPGMFAIRDARRIMVNELPRIAKKYSRRIARRS